MLTKDLLLETEVLNIIKQCNGDEATEPNAFYRAILQGVMEHLER